MVLAFTGFYGQKNIGDQAFVKVLRERFPNARFTPGEFVGDETDVVVGGGAYENWMVEKAPPDANLYGIGIGFIRDAIGPLRAKYLRRFKYLGVRDYHSLELAKAWGIKAKFSGYLSYLLEPTTCDALRGKIAVAPRWDMDPWPYLSQLEKRKIVFVPCHPYDTERTKGKIFVTESPQELLGAFSKAEKVVVFGKLHAKVFAHVVGVPYFDLTPDVKGMAFQAVVASHTPSSLKSVVSKAIDDLRSVLPCAG